MSLSILNEALARLSILLQREDAGIISVSLPGNAWQRLRYELGHKQVQLSVDNGMGGIVCDYPPPEGKSWANGFWFYGCWVERAG